MQGRAAVTKVMTERRKDLSSDWKARQMTIAVLSLSSGKTGTEFGLSVRPQKLKMPAKAGILFSTLRILAAGTSRVYLLGLIKGVK